MKTISYPAGHAIIKRWEKKEEGVRRASSGLVSLTDVVILLKIIQVDTKDAQNTQYCE